jgi:hypothetical protein
VGVIVLTPEVDTSPMPSIVAVVALAVCQVSTTGLPAVTAAGDAEMLAVGDGAWTGGAVATGCGGIFFLQPAVLTTATKDTTATRM